MIEQKKLNKLIDDTLGSINWDKEPYLLYQPLKYILDLGGKRIRPKFALTTYNLFSDKIDNSILHPAIAIELFHNFTLIHDDIMDKAELRRGKATVYKRWDNNIAILSGDAMCISSYSLLANAPKQKVQEILRLFSKTAIEVCEGQQFDMNFENLDFVEMGEYEKMIGLKTAVLIACSAKIGAIIANANEQICNQLYDFAYQLGVAFQIQDDIFDSFGDEETFGKKIGGDILNNKKTWLLVKSMNIANEKQKDELKRLLALPNTNPKEKIKEFQQFYKNLGIKELAEEEVKKYYQISKNILNKISLTHEQKDRLEEFADYIVGRIN